MPAFSITATGGFPPPTADEFPEYLQWQTEGTDLGLPDVDTVNITGDGVTTTRGSGANANTVTIDIPGGGGGGGAIDMLSLRLDEDTDVTMNGTPMVGWTGSEIFTATNSSWDEATSEVVLITPGTYRITATFYLSINDSRFEVNPVLYGSTVSGALFPYNTSHFVTITNQVDPPAFGTVVWTDIFFYRTYDEANTRISIGVYANTYNGGSQTAFTSGRLSVEYINDANRGAP